MRVVQVDYLQDVEHGGHHLDREIGPLILNQFHPTARQLIKILQSVTISISGGYEVTVVMSVKQLNEAGLWNFGENTPLLECSAGMLVITNNHFCIWLARPDRSPAHLIASIFFEHMLPLCENKTELCDYVRNKVRQGMKMSLDKRIRDLDRLAHLHDEIREFSQMYASLCPK